MILALDLEGTLISNAVSQIPRPGLYAFLEEAKTHASRIVFYTAVTEPRVRSIVDEIVRRGEAPDWVAGIERIEWAGSHKRLYFVPGSKTEPVLLVDDMRHYVHPDDMGYWVEVKPFVAPYPDDDTELVRVLDRIERKQRQFQAKQKGIRP